MAAGKAAGALTLWSAPGSPDKEEGVGAPSSSAAVDGRAGEVSYTGSVHGSPSVTGVGFARRSLSAGGPSPERPALLATSAMDGSARAWRWDGSQVREEGGMRVLEELPAAVEPAASG